MAWPSSIPSFTALTALPAASLNLIRDALNVLGGSWSTYTPTWTGSTTDPTVGASTVSGRYRLVGKTVDVHISITIGSGFSAGSGNYTWSLPPGCSIMNNAASESLGTGTARDVAPSATSRAFAVYYFSGTAVAMFKSDDGTVVGSASPFTWATGDRITLHIPALEIV